MLATLLESKAVRARRPGAATTSVVVHLALMIGAVFATARAGSGIVAPPKADTLIYVDHPAPPSSTSAAPAANASAPSTTAAPAPVLIPANFDIPDVIPGIDITRAAVTDLGIASALRDPGVPSGARTSGGGVGAPDMISNPMADKPAVSLGNKPPDYPATLRAARLEGTVEARFVVDTAGRADMSSFTVLSSTHDLFTKAVRDAMPKMRYLPAEVRDRKVRVIVQQTFAFVLKG